MKKVLLIAALALCNLGSFAQSQEEMQKMMEMAQPAEMHKMLAEYAGNWTSSNKMWMDPAAPPMETTSNMTSEMTMDGRYLRSTYNGDFNGMPFMGEGTLAYDNARKVFINTWLDNMGTGVMYSEGTWDKASKSITLKGKMSSGMDATMMPFRQVMTFTDKDNYKMEMYVEFGGQEMKSMEINFKRNK